MKQPKNPNRKPTQVEPVLEPAQVESALEPAQVESALEPAQVEPARPRDDRPLIVGAVTGQHGVRGWLKVFSHMRPAEEMLQYDRWLLAPRHDAQAWDAHDWRHFEVAAARAQGKQLLAKLAGIDSRDAAEQLTGSRIAVRHAQLPRPAAGEYYWSDLIGLRVFNRDGVMLGRVDHLLETGANDVLAVTREDAHGLRAERLLPWGADVIVEVDAAGGCIRVDWEAE